ncbi:MAG: oxidoreductase [Ornithinibacter sp.]
MSHAAPSANTLDTRPVDVVQWAMRILVLGGTAWLGGEVAALAQGAGHQVTCLARGSAAAPERTAFVAGDRDTEGGLSAVDGARWDAVVDVSRHPGQVRRATRQLDAGHWVLVSSANVYADFSTLEQDEDSRVRAPLDGEVMTSMDVYGEAKVACEEAMRAAEGTATIVRSGLLGGPGDWTGRTGYWPWRFAHPVDEEVVVPDDPGFPCALIDVRDLAGWIVSAAEHGLDGTFNATGPTTPLAEVLDTARHLGGAGARPRPVPGARLAELGVAAWMGPRSLPLWIDDPQWRGFATLDTSRARACGLVTRPLRETLADAAAHEEVRVTPRRAGLSDEEEREVLRLERARG